MRKLIYYVAVSVDGFIAAPDGQTDFFLAEGDHMPWLLETYPETIPGHIRGMLGLQEAQPRQFDTVLLGRATHQIAVNEGLASGYPHLRQYVVTHRPEDLPAEEGLSASADDPVELVQRLKAQDSPLDIWLCGGGALAASVADEIDEFRLKVNPVMLGEGIPLIAAGVAGVARSTGASGATGFAGLPLRRRMVREFESGVIYTEYVRT